jgi:hypothetical protein
MPLFQRLGQLENHLWTLWGIPLEFIEHVLSLQCHAEWN